MGCRLKSPVNMTMMMAKANAGITGWNAPDASSPMSANIKPMSTVNMTQPFWTWTIRSTLVSWFEFITRLLL